MTFERIIHPTAFDSQVAFEHALRLALAARCELDLIHVEADQERAGHEWEAFPEVRTTLARWGLLSAGSEPSAVAETLGVHVIKRDLAGGQTVEALSSVTRSADADLLVFGTATRGRLGRLLKPSVSEAVTRRARVPALFIPESSSGFLTPEGLPRLRNILFPVGGGVAPALALSIASHISQMMDQTPALHRLCVSDGAPGRLAADTLFDRNEIRSGPVAETIAAYADEIDADLIVMSTAGHDSWRDTAFGSLTEQVLHLSRHALLAVPV